MQNTKNFNLIVTEKHFGTRLDKFISDEIFEISRSHAKKLIENSHVKVNMETINSPSCKLTCDYVVEIENVKFENHTEIKPNNIPINVVFEDEYLIIINKQAGLTVHPGAGNHENTLVNALMYHGKNLSQIAGFERPGIVHRLDKDTSGLMIIAKNDHIHGILSKMIEEREFERKYKALIWGTTELKSGKIVTNIRRSKADKTKMMNVPHGGKNAITHFKILDNFCNGSASLVECKLDTGRTHQIRLHFLHKGNSLIGDPIYGKKGRRIKSLNEKQFNTLSNFHRQALHSYKVSFTHPISGEDMMIESELPSDMQELVDMLK